MTTTTTAPTARGPLEREFRHAYRTAHGLSFLVGAGLLAVLAVGGWALLNHMHSERAWKPGVMGGFAFILLTAATAAARGHKFLSIRTRVFADRVVVRGMTSGGKMRWDEVAEVKLEKIAWGERSERSVHKTAYYLRAADGRIIRVDGDIKPADEFERIVREKTGLRVVDETSTTLMPTTKHTHAAFARKS